MDNGTEVIAKLPNPIAGPAYYTTASEVATREFVSIAILQSRVEKFDLMPLAARRFTYSHPSNPSLVS